MIDVSYETMSSVTEVKQATEQLSPNDRWELFVWLRQSSDVRSREVEELRRDIAVGIQQADAGNVAPLDIASVRAKIHQRLKGAVDS